jgi:hypothetical protein
MLIPYDTLHSLAEQTLTRSRSKLRNNLRTINQMKLRRLPRTLLKPKANTMIKLFLKMRSSRMRLSRATRTRRQARIRRISETI